MVDVGLLCLGCGLLCWSVLDSGMLCCWCVCYGPQLAAALVWWLSLAAKAESVLLLLWWLICFSRWFLTNSEGSLKFNNPIRKNLKRMGVKVTILSSVSAQKRMTKASSQTPDGLTFIAFSDGYDDGLKLSDNQEHYLSEHKRRGSKALSELIKASSEEGCPVTGVVYVMLRQWAAEVARGFNIPSAPLWVQPATIFALYFYYFNGYGDLIKKFCDDTSCAIELLGLGKLTSHDVPTFMLPSNTFSIAFPGFKEQLDALIAEINPKILVNAFDALESKALRAIGKHNLIAIGPLVPSAFLDGKDPSDNAFGRRSITKIKRLCRVVGFEASIIDGEKQEDKLSCKDELKKQEGLVLGIPVMCLPQFSDQPTNAKLLEDEYKTRVRATKNEEGVVEADEIKRCIVLVMGDGENGEEIRNAKKWKYLAKEAAKEGGLSDKNLSAFVDEIEDGF
ncbi:hypothetical protein TEA_012387 [Camellia sinensis var. sinensis]|uniref:Uncharacterized protein n=1 Tax=Camellia sinensis var. sinensis TaxID=542762 RepID=A0A4S4DBY3_CAMSN|nr:hypothetical protein TEA_012387 [Camellia sinensis var. sinensis]